MLAKPSVLLFNCDCDDIFGFHFFISTRNIGELVYINLIVHARKSVHALKVEVRHQNENKGEGECK